MTLARVAIAVAVGSGTAVHAQNTDVIVLNPIVIESESDATLLQDGYVAESGRQATKVDSQIATIPQSIGVVTQDQVEDQEPRTLLETLGYSSGVSVGNFAFDSRYDAFYLRGFPAYYTGLFRDGLRQVNGPSAWYRNDPYTFEAVSILKGPASSLYGVSGPGGLVNTVSKRPKEETFREVVLTGGTENRAEAAFDFTGPATENGRLKYRLTGVLRDADTPLDGYSDDLALLAPALTYELTDRTRVTLLGEYAQSTVGGTASYYNPSYGEASDLYQGDPDYNDFDQTQYRIGYEVEHDLSEDITLRQNLRYSYVDADLEYSGYYPAGTDLARYWGHYTEDMEVFTVDTLAEYRFSTGSIDHTLITGIDYTASDYDAASAVGYVSAQETAALDPPYSGGQEMEQIGVYAHDQMQAGSWTLFLSGRYDWVDTTSIAADRTETNTDDEAFSGRIGVSYAMLNGLTPFANLSSSFSPNVGAVYDDVTSDLSRPADPTIGLQKEIGIKYQLPGTESLITASIFDIEQRDGVVFDTSTGINKQRQFDLRSRGFELEGTANFSDSIRMTAAYSYLDIEIEKGATDTKGNQLSATPHHTGSIWAFYEPQRGPLAGFGFGGGLRYIGESWGDDENTFKNDDFVFADLALSYDFRSPDLEGLHLQVNVKNVFDETGQTCSAGYCYRYEGRTATASLRYRF
ncbi:TonB-dependent siderophore receptor [Qingshengfaniella alkalisoli]|uniref:TonB-dependent siderophore receptor n=1 Tax=Qingshengfaniella alkalisoli TaxID=2599296 RepID=A0A5B8IVI6_9RHOB|nr:TonB-dependent siderophore receptor [Qingshengfaniella alkalisoli]QDY69624.1 TonB-dependent siderophore receptor [Qingshengfaniella alkalisoli]